MKKIKTSALEQKIAQVNKNWQEELSEQHQREWKEKVKQNNGWWNAKMWQEEVERREKAFFEAMKQNAEPAATDPGKLYNQYYDDISDVLYDFDEKITEEFRNEDEGYIDVYEGKAIYKGVVHTSPEILGVSNEDDFVNKIVDDIWHGDNLYAVKEQYDTDLDGPLQEFNIKKGHGEMVSMEPLGPNTYAIVSTIPFEAIVDVYDKVREESEYNRAEQMYEDYIARQDYEASQWDGPY